MPRPRSDRRSALPVAVPVVVLLLLLGVFLYVASVGPTAYFVVHDLISMETYLTFYAPIMWCEYKSPVISAAMNHYREIFVDDWEWFAALIEGTVKPVTGFTP